MELPLESSPEEVAEALRRGAALVDVREPWEHEQERIPGSVLIPLNELAGRLGEVPPDRDVYVHCKAGNRSARAVQLLREAGRERSSSVAGGIDAWSEAGLPTD